MRVNVNPNRVVQAVMAAALVITGAPLIAPWLPHSEPTLVATAEDLPPVPGQLVVEARHALSSSELGSLNARFRIDLHDGGPEEHGKLLVASVPVGQEAAYAARLKADGLVEDAEPMFRVHKLMTPNDPLFSKQWNFKMVGAERAWDKTAGKGVTVAVIDTGVAFESDERCYQAQDFKGTHFVQGHDFVHGDDHPNDDEGHGTHVSGTIAETTGNGEGATGLAYEANVMPLKALDAYGSGTYLNIAEAIYWAADHGANVINMSLGGRYPDPTLRKACQYAVGKGVLIVCAAGNSGGGPVGYPAAFPECMAVSAVGPSGNITSYSSVGKEVAIAAPGGDTQRGSNPDGGVLQNTVDYSSGERKDDYFAYNGTSMASPHVAAAAALVISRGVTDPAQVREILLKGAKPKSPSNKYGAGVLDAAKAVDLADNARRDSLLKLLATLVAGLAGVGVGVVRGHVRGLLRFPFMTFGLALGLLGPDLIFNWIGFGSPFNILLHSALVPLYLLWEAESRVVYRFVGAAAVGSAVHLLWDAAWGHAPFAGIIPAHGVPWLWVNGIVAVGVALVAWRRSYSHP